MEWIIIMTLVAMVAVPYFAPSIIAQIRVKRTVAAVFALNLLLGWTLIGRVVALGWARTRDAPESDPSVRSSR